MSHESDIPERHQLICKALAKVARENGLTSFSGSYKPAFKDGWRGDISFNWAQGRHGEDSDEIKITSQFFVHAKLGGE